MDGYEESSVAAAVEVADLKIKQLKDVLRYKGVQMAGVSEKSELQQLVRDNASHTEINMASTGSLPAHDPLAGNKEINKAEREAAFFKQQAEAAAAQEAETRASMSPGALQAEAEQLQHDDKKKSMLKNQMRSYSKTSLAKGKKGGRSSLGNRESKATTQEPVPEAAPAVEHVAVTDLKVSQLKKLLKFKGVSTAGASEKKDLQDLVSANATAEEIDAASAGTLGQ
jgi:hypothetical protein